MEAALAAALAALAGRFNADACRADARRATPGPAVLPLPPVLDELLSYDPATPPAPLLRASPDAAPKARFRTAGLRERQV